jgi:hypothetical protein
MNFDKTLAVVAKTTDVAKLRRIMENVRRHHDETHILVRELRNRVAFLTGPFGDLGEAFETVRVATIATVGNDCRLGQMRNNRGVVGAIERLVCLPGTSKAFRSLVASGRVEDTFESLVMRQPDAFSPATVMAAQHRLASHTKG